MSKAFTKEPDAGVDDEPLPERASILPPGTPNYVTPRGHRALRRARDALVGHLAATPLERRERDRQLRAVQRALDTAEVVTPALEVAPESVRFGVSVTVEDTRAAVHTYEIVGVDEADGSRGRISWLSPIARALMGHAIGDTVVVHSPRGDDELTVVRLAHLPDDERA